MQIAVLADDIKWNELTNAPANVDWIRCLTEEDLFKNVSAAIYINLMEDAFNKDYTAITKPVLINAVSNTLQQINPYKNVVRINGWNTFLARDNWEAAGTITEPIENFFSAIKKTIIIMPDEPGFISARIIAMIINEAYFSLGENLSTREEIDIAMQLGVNYPYGPFEWCDKIGIINVYTLLKKLSDSDKRYLPAPLLKQQATT